MRPRLLPFFVVIAGLGLGCSANVVASPETADAEATPSSAAFIEISRSGGDASRVVARFARVRGGAIGEQETDLLRVGLNLPALETCALASTPRRVADAPSPRAVELADVGALSVEAAGASTSLTARQLPDVVDLVSGVVYSGEASLPSRGRHDLRAAGRSDVDVPAFSISVQSPGDLVDLRVAGQAASAVAFGPGAVDLSWDPGAVDDVVYVDVSSRGQATMRCAFADAGRATLPASIFADEGTLTVHRVHRESFRARGIDRGEVRFDLAKSVAFARH